jgi:hydroxymethylpyrimidine/phosphomethylpyrimidine kinase
MGHVLPDRMFWAQAETDGDESTDDKQPVPGDDTRPALTPSKPFFDLPPNGTTKH